jgi:uncharacterized membrane protein
MKNNDNDRLIRSFMQENKKEVEDVFFSKKVMQKLPPAQRSKEWIVILFAGLGTLIAWLIGGGTSIQLHEMHMQLTEQLNSYYLIGALFGFPLIVLAFYYLKEKQIQLI